MEIREFSPDGKKIFREVGIGDDRYIGDVTSNLAVDIPTWIVTSPDISDKGLRLWATLRAYMVGAVEFTGTSHSSLADFLGTSVSSVRRSIKELEKAGALVTQARFKNGKQLKNFYYLWPANPELVESRVLTSEHDVHPRTADICINTDISIDQKSDTVRRKASYSEEFEKLWDIYPRKVGKNKAYGAFNSTLKRGVSVEELTEAVTAYAAKRIGESDVYTMHPSTFFGPDERWREFVEVEEIFVMTDEQVVVAKIYDSYDAVSIWIHPETEETMLDNPAKHGYVRPVNKNGMLVDANGQPYSLDSGGSRRSAEYWN